MRKAIAHDRARQVRHDSLRQNAIDAWNAYQSTGEHATMEDADAWLARLQAGEDAEPPVCRSRTGRKRHRAAKAGV